MKPKIANIAGLQLADILAYPVRQAMQLDKGAIPDPGENFGKRIHEVAKEKLNINAWKGQAEGYGKIWL